MTIIGAREFETKNPMDLPNEAVSLGPNHAPTPHRLSAQAMIEAIEGNGLTLVDQTHVVDGVRNMDRGGN